MIYITEYYHKSKWYMHELFQKHIHKVKLYPSAENLHIYIVILVTIITSDGHVGHVQQQQ